MRKLVLYIGEMWDLYENLIHNMCTIVYVLYVLQVLFFSFICFIKRSSNAIFLVTIYMYDDLINFKMGFGQSFLDIL